MHSLSEIKAALDYDPSSGVFIRKPRADVSNALNARFAGRKTGCPAVNGYLRIRVDNTLYYAHRLAWFLTYGTMPDGAIDHINGDRSDNRLENLRLATPAENSRNSRSYGKSGFKGVFPHGRRWLSKITANGVTRRLGVFDTKEQAHAAYCAAASELHGQFARTR